MTPQVESNQALRRQLLQIKLFNFDALPPEDQSLLVEILATEGTFTPIGLGAAEALARRYTKGIA